MFSVAGCFAFPAFIFIVRIWPSLESESIRVTAEWCLIVSFCLFPFILLAWVLSLYDALRVGSDEIKKEPLRKRMEYAINRVRVHGWGRTIFSYFKINIMFSLFLVIALVVAFRYFPKEYYVDGLRNLRAASLNKDMRIVPRVIDGFLHSRAEK